MKRRLVSFVEKSSGIDFRDEILWKRGAGCTPIWSRLWNGRPDLREGLTKAIPRIDDSAIDEVVVRFKSEWLDDRVVEVKKHFSDDKEIRQMSIIEPIKYEEPVPTNTGQTAYDVLMAKAEQLRERFPTLTTAQAFEKVYTDPANSALTQAERRGSGMYGNDSPLEDATAVAKAAIDVVRKAGLPPMATLEPDDLGNYETGPAMSGTAGLRSGFPSTDEIMQLIKEEQRKGYNFEMATTRVGADLFEAERRQKEKALIAAGVTPQAQG